MNTDSCSLHAVLFRFVMGVAAAAAEYARLPDEGNGIIRAPFLYANCVHKPQPHPTVYAANLLCWGHHPTEPIGACADDHMVIK